MTAVALVLGLPLCGGRYRASLERIQHDGGWADTRMVEYYTHTKHDPLNATTHLVAAHVFSAG